ncbi:hypothetical protein GCM10022225_42210 [Plantactinospora mayteni]|uniref:AAA+ ATPase domain-containing protein n=1 Tax=Plantactinospora mayteni TaxID=566021 RepID=A0ABQ4EUA6_9ACTN|nr:alpha-amylase family protein [Plantactinospora mayteni]GIG98245.1 hypothetical protein Pma05_48180 [Plantactinospora mayteni]
MVASGRRHRRRQRPHHDDCPACSGNLEPELVAARSAAIKNLNDELANLGDPIAEIFESLTSEEFTGLVWQTPNPDRTKFLTDLGVPAVKRPTTVAARMGLAKLCRWPEANRVRAGRFLTAIVANGIEAAWHAAQDEQDREHAVQAAVTQDPNQATAMRLALLSYGHDSWAMTVALRLGIDNGLALPSWPQAVLSGITAACRQLEDVWAHVAAALHQDTREPSSFDENLDDNPVRENTSNPDSLASPTTSAAPTPQGPANVSSQPTHEPSDSAPSESAATKEQELTDAATALTEQQYAARQAATTLAASISSGKVPDLDTLRPITTFIHAAYAVRDLLIQTGRSVPGPLTVEHLLSELTAAANALQLSDQRARIAAFAALTGPETERTRLADAAALATALTAAPTWTTEQQQYAAGLQALLDLVAAVAAKDSQALATALTAAEQNLPDNLEKLRFAALVGQLHVGPLGTVGVIEPSPANLPQQEIVSAPDPASDPADAPVITRTNEPLTPPDPAPAPAPTSVTVRAPSVTGGPPQPLAPAPESHAGNGHTDSAQPNDAEPDDGQADTIDHAAGRELVRELLGAGRLSLAFHAAAACGDRRRADALRILALADAVRSETAPTAGALRTALETEQNNIPSGDPAAQLLLLAGAVRACLVTAEAFSGEIVLALIRVLPQFPSLATMCATIGNASAHGWLSDPAVLTALAPLAGADNDIAATVDAAKYERDRRRTLEFVPANHIAEMWWSRTGLIGRLLDAAAHDRRAELESVTEELRKFAKRQHLDDLLTREDARLRAHSSRPLQGQVRRKLREMAYTSVNVVREWVDAVRANQRTRDGQGPVPAHLSALRQEVKAQWPAAEQELLEIASGGPSMLRAEAAQACRDNMQRTVDMLDGIELAGADRDPDVVLHQDLLRCTALAFTSAGTPARPITVDDVRTAAATRWEEALEGRLAGEEYATAGLIIDAVTDPARARALHDRLTTAAARTNTELEALHRDVAGEVARAARLGQLNETASSTVGSLLEAANVAQLAGPPETQNLGVLRGHLLDVRASLPKYLQEAQEALHKRVDNEVTVDEESEGLLAAIRERIDAGDLATAEEYLLAAVHGEAPPTAEPSADLGHFIRLIEQMPGGITRELIAAVRAGKPFAGLDLAVLSSTQRAGAAEGLQVWLDMRDVRHSKVQKSALAAALRLAGIEFFTLRQLQDPPASSRRAWWDLTGVRRIGETLVPQFGSAAADRQRIMLCWGDPDVRAMFGWIAQDPGTDHPVIVLMFAPMTAAQRTTLAVECAQRSEKPVIVLDDIALVYLVMHGGLQFTATARILLPFAATNPYSPEGLGALPSEMFFGRKSERNRIIASNGPNLLYGGRQLGKTALLQDAARRFERVDKQVAVYVSLPNAIGTRVNPVVLWEKIAEKLTELKIMRPRKTHDPAKDVTTAVTAWLDGDATRRMLLLIDECDGFFDADAATGFLHVAQLRDLRDRTDRRFKPVFAGLHQVQRFAHLPNQPLAGAHLGEQIAIGPLSPEPAYQLLFIPLETLGIRFAADKLIHRVLAYCNYQPKLLQLVGQALVASALSRRRGGPPYEISEDDLDQVIGSEDLQWRVRQTVHLTLDLDSRYKLIALVVALAALEHGADRTMSTSKLREECQGWWPEGFAGQGADEFRSLLEEMRDLGVLAVTAGWQWRLRSSNVLRLLGSATEIWEELCSPQWRTTVTKLSAEQARRRLDGGLISPCTEQQISRLVGRVSGNSVRVVVGTPATGVERVRTLLEEAHKGFGARFDLAVSNRPSAYQRALRIGEPGGVHRVVLSPLTTAKVETVIDSIAKAVRMQPAAGTTRTVVVVVDATAEGILDALTGPGTSINSDDVMTLRRVSGVGLRSWLSDNDLLAPFSDVASHTELMAATGGWLLLLDHVADKAREISRPRRICDHITASLATVDGASELVAATGLRTDSRVEAAFQLLVEYDDPVTSEELVQLCAEAGTDPERTAGILQMLDVMHQSDVDGRWTPEPVITRAWRSLQGAL